MEPERDEPDHPGYLGRTARCNPPDAPLREQSCTVRALEQLEPGRYGEELKDPTRLHIAPIV